MPNVSDLLGQPGDRRVVLTWRNPNHPALASVRLLRRTDQVPAGPTDPAASLRTDAMAETFTDTGLRNGQKDYYGVYPHDGAGKFATGSFVTAVAQGSQADTTPPNLTVGPFVETSDTLALIKWQTNEAGTSVVEFGLTSGLGSTATAGGFSSEHAVTLVTLAAQTTYFYRACSDDASSNRRCSTIASFATSADTIPPALSQGPNLLHVGAQTALLGFETNKPARYDVLYGKTDSYGRQAQRPPLVVRQRQPGLEAEREAAAWGEVGAGRDVASPILVGVGTVARLGERSRAGGSQVHAVSSVARRCRAPR